MGPHCASRNHFTISHVKFNRLDRIDSRPATFGLAAAQVLAHVRSVRVEVYLGTEQDGRQLLRVAGVTRLQDCWAEPRLLHGQCLRDSEEKLGFVDFLAGRRAEEEPSCR